MSTAPVRPTFQLLSLRHLAYFIFVALMIISAFLLVNSGILETWASRGGVWWLVMGFVGGLFFTSFSAMPISVAIFIALSRVGIPIYEVALLGGVGAMIGDVGLLETLKVSILDDVLAYLAWKTHGAFKEVMHQPLIRVFAIIVGALIVASPLPDEIGLAMMGVTHLKVRSIMFISFVINTAAVGLFCYLVR